MSEVSPSDIVEETPDEQPGEETPDEQPGSEEKGSEEKGSEEQEGKPEPKQDDKSAEQPPARAPEQYADFKFPDGVQVEKAELEQFQTLLKDVDVDQEGAQKLLDYALEREGRIAKAIVEQGDKAVEDLVRQRTAAAKADPEVGGDAYDESLQLMAKTIGYVFGDNATGAQEFAKVMKESLTGNHVETLRFFRRLSKVLPIKEHAPPGGGGPVRSDRSPEERLYGSMKE